MSESPPENGPETGPETPPPPPPPPGVEPLLPPELQTVHATPEDRNLAMIAHLLGLTGFLGPLILYLVKYNGSSPFAQFHMKQSLWFQVFGAIAVFVVAMVSIPLTLICIGYLTLLLAMAMGVGLWVYAIVGAIQVSGGKDFEYYWVGPWVRRETV